MSSVVNVNKWELNKPTDEHLAKFCEAVRDKEDWHIKVLDEVIVLKWAIEAELAAPDSRVLEGDALEAVSDLRRSALAIRNLDCDISLNVRADSSLQHFDETGLETDLQKTLKYARGSKYGLREPELKDKGLGVFVSDDLVPLALHQELIRQLDALAAKEPRDFHPGSFGKVQDLIHPSLYPYISGITGTSSDDVKSPPTETDGKFYTSINTQLTEHGMGSLFVWIPSIFKVSPDGTNVLIDSYINGLGTREEHPGLFRVIERMFLLALPHFEKTMNANYTLTPELSTPSFQRWMERHQFASDNQGALTREMWAQFIDEHSSKWDARKLEEKEDKERLQRDIRQEDSIKKSFYDLGDEFVASEVYKGQELKVIVKPHERIVASVIYYYDTDESIEDQGLSFRRFRDLTNDFPPFEDWATSDYRIEDFDIRFKSMNGEDVEVEDNYPSHPVSIVQLPYFIKLGTVPTTNIRTGVNGTGRILSFPNWLQVYICNASKACSYLHCCVQHKLCFFLVDDTVQDKSEISYPGFSIDGLQDINVLTTSEIPMQMRKCNEPTMRALISVISLIDIIWKYVSEGTLSREDAEMYRLTLMRDRKVSTTIEENNYSLCEH
ncbi:hypothetical protein BDP27DRAFT_1333464 [Rhodocollybia butyracea]|uniref:DUF4246 domain-containing protein n=1 Tax=Rhodocollybia butyracea TaxID=206335 RepID=A0A9P5PJG3_9AGAR|nr:hypothetical protein BDP27DRAFT_1333464 [Rhodocollybia butyracea]